MNKNNNMVLGIILIMLLATGGSLTAQNNALDFDGTGDYIDATTSMTLSGSTVTLEAWINVDVFKPSSPYITSLFGIEGTSNICLLRLGDLGLDNNKLQFALRIGGANIKLNGITALATNTWYHVAATYDGATMKIYVNGILDASASQTGSFTASGNFLLAKSELYPSDRYLDGQIDEVRVWSDVRSQAEIRANMYQELGGSESNLVAYYKFDETTGTTASDSQTSGTYDGTLTGFSFDNNAFPSPAFFGPKNSLDFDGVDDYVLIPSDASLNNNTFSVEFWVQFDDMPNNWDGIIDKGRYNGSSLAANDWYFLTYNSLEEIVLIGAPGLGEIALWLNDNNWHHIAASYDGSTMTAYLDGVESGTVTGAYTSTTNGISIGRCLTGIHPFNGHLDEVRIWSDARTATEIAENMCKSLTGNESGLVAYYNFDNTSGTILQDFSGNSNDGTLTNMTGTYWVSSTAFNTWLNTSSTDWATGENWSDGSAPGSTDNVGINNHSGSSPTLSGSPTVNNLVVGSSAGVTLSSGFTVNGNLFLNDDLDLNGQIITLGSSATLIEGSGKLYGSSGTITTTRVLSNISAENIGGLGAEITTTANLGSTTITRGHAAQSGSIQRYFDITPTTNNTGLSATLVFHYFDAELNGQNENILELFRSVDAGSNWTKIGGTVNTAANTVTLSPIDAFSRWTSAQDDNPLPVELSSFTVEVTNQGVLCRWTTESEIENLGFMLERKTEDADWIEIASYKTDDNLLGQGTISSYTDYEYLDIYVEPNTIYEYRLADVDYEGVVTYHSTRTVTVGNTIQSSLIEEFTVLPAYPNPFNPSTIIKYAIPEVETHSNASVQVQIYDITGKLITTLFNGEQTPGWHSVVWNGTNQHSEQAPAGLYFSRITSGNEVKTTKLMLLR